MGILVINRADDSTGEKGDLDLVSELRAMVLAQAGQIAKLEAILDGREAGMSKVTESRMSRGGMLKAAAAVAAGAVGVSALSAAGPATALAAGNARRATADASFTAYGTDSTYTPDSTIGFDASDTSSGLDTGVSAYGTSVGIAGTTDSPDGYGVVGMNNAKASNASGVLGACGKGVGTIGASVTGTGVYGSAEGSGYGVQGDSLKGVGVHAVSFDPNHAALLAENAKGGDAIHGASQSARGAVLSGGKAAIQLTPTTTNSHPLTGQPGDLMVDKFHRLWFCQHGGSPAKWVQIA